MTLEELNVKITADIDGLRKELQKTQTEVKQFTTQVETSNNNVAKSYQGLASKIPVAMIVGAIAKIAKSAIEAASALQEVQNVVEVSFGESAGMIDFWSRQMKNAFGLSEKSAKQYASTFKTIGDSMGLSDSASGQMAKNLTQLSADMASFYNAEAEQTSNALQAIYTGNAQALKQYGIVLSETTLEEFAASNGLKKKYSEMSQAEKVLLRYQYVMQVTNKSQGDFLRTQDSIANQTKLLKENLNELLVQLGTALAPVVQTLLKAANDLVPAVSDLIKGFAELTEASQPLTDVVTEIIKNDLATIFRVIGKTLSTMAPVIETISKAVGPILELVNKILMLPVELLGELMDFLKDPVPFKPASMRADLILIGDAIDDVGEAAKDAASYYGAIDYATAVAEENVEETEQGLKKIKNLISGFDELNIFQSQQSIGSITGGGYNFGAGGTLTTLTEAGALGTGDETLSTPSATDSKLADSVEAIRDIMENNPTATYYFNKIAEGGITRNDGLWPTPRKKLGGGGGR